jgi:hypothetical protein
MRTIFFFLLICFTTLSEAQEVTANIKNDKNELAVFVGFGRSFRNVFHTNSKEFYLDPGNIIEGVFSPDYEVYRNTSRSNNGYVIGISYNRFFNSQFYTTSSLDLYNSVQTKYPIVSKEANTDFIEIPDRFSESKYGMFLQQGIGGVPLDGKKVALRLEAAFAFGFIQDRALLDPIYVIADNETIIHQGYITNELSSMFVGGTLGACLMYNFNEKLGLGLKYQYRVGALTKFKEFDNYQQIGISFYNKF